MHATDEDVKAIVELQKTSGSYKSPDMRRSSAVATASEQKRIIDVIKKGMNE